MTKSIVIFVISVISGVAMAYAVHTGAEPAHAFHKSILFSQYLGGETSSAEGIVERVSSAVVRIEIQKEIPVQVVTYGWRNGLLRIGEVEEKLVKKAVSSGSGFFISSDGYLITNKHVVADESADFLITTDDEDFLAEVVYRDPNYDLALLKIEGSEFPFLTLVESSELNVGDAVIAVGNALGRYTDSASTGTIVGLGRSITVSNGIQMKGRQFVLAFEEISGLIETSAKVYPGDSGGPLLDEEGKVIGVHIATAIGERVGFAIPSEIVKKMLQDAGIEI